MLTHNTPRKSREGNLLIFSKDKQTKVSYGRFFHETETSIFGSPLIRMSFGFSNLS